jgi:hypothetical protein
MLTRDGGMALFGTAEVLFAPPELPVAIEFPCLVSCSVDSMNLSCLKKLMLKI